MSQNQQPKGQSSRSVAPTVPSITASQRTEESLRRSANQDFLRSLSQLEQTLMADAKTPALTQKSSPALSSIPVSHVFDDPTNSLQTAINHLDIEESELAEAVADIEHFMTEQGIPLDSPLANHIRTAAAEAASEPTPSKPAAAVEPHTK